MNPRFLSFSGFDRSKARATVFIALLLIAGWNTVTIYVHQKTSMAAPGGALAAFMTLGFLLLSHRLPSSTGGTLGGDSETDWIFAFALCGVGVWMIYWLPGRFADHFWLWRPDTFGLMVCALGIASLLGGTRFALWIGAPIFVTSVVTAPIVQILATGTHPTATRVAIVSALLGISPWLLARPYTHVRIWRRYVALVPVIVIATGVAVVIGGPDWMVSVTAGLIVAVGSWWVVRAVTPRRNSIAMPNVPFTRQRWLPVMAIVVGAACVELLLPTATFTPVSSLTTPHGTVQGHYRTSLGLTVTQWSLPSPTPTIEYLVTTITGKNKWTVLTYPMGTMLAIPQPACPNISTFHNGRRQVTATLYLDQVYAFRWQFVSWLQEHRNTYQRVAVTIATGPVGSSIPPIGVTPYVGVDAGYTLGSILANRHLLCEPFPLVLQTALAMNPNTTNADLIKHSKVHA